jgi:uncharacterized protein DUF4184
MPFTVSHPAAVLPVLRWLPPSAVVVGSLVPDIPLCVRPPVGYHTTHSLAGVVTVDLPLGLTVHVPGTS